MIGYSLLAYSLHLPYTILHSDFRARFSLPLVLDRSVRFEKTVLHDGNYYLKELQTENRRKYVTYGMISIFYTCQLMLLP